LSEALNKTPTNFDDVKLLNSFRRETRFNFLFNRKLPMYCRMFVDSFTMQMYKNIRFIGVNWRKIIKIELQLWLHRRVVRYFSYNLQKPIRALLFARQLTWMLRLV